MRSGIPQRAKARRSVTTVSIAGTFIHRPEGKNAGQEESAGIFIDDPQPRDLDAVGQADLLGSIHLPDLMRPQGALPRRRREFGPWRSCQVVASEPTLERPDTRDGVGAVLAQEHAVDQRGSPASVLSPEGQGRLPDLLAQNLGSRGRATIVGTDRGLTAPAEALEEVAHRADGQGQLLGDAGGGLTGLPPPPDHPSDRNGHRTRHGEDSREGSEKTL
jgi:hypothetical protein